MWELLAAEALSLHGLQTRNWALLIIIPPQMRLGRLQPLSGAAQLPVAT
jgi:hypothetical protein